MQRDPLPGVWQLGKSGERNVQLVADATDVYDDPRGGVLRKNPLEACDHGSTRTRTRGVARRRRGAGETPAASRRPPCAWRIATASASAASLARTRSISRRRLTIRLTWSFVARPLP